VQSSASSASSPQNVSGCSTSSDLSDSRTLQPSALSVVGRSVPLSPVLRDSMRSVPTSPTGDADRAVFTPARPTRASSRSRPSTLEDSAAHVSSHGIRSAFEDPAVPGSPASSHDKEANVRTEVARKVPLTTPEISCPNQYEALIRPDEHSVTSDPFLLCTPYIVNRKHMALICTCCKHGVRPDSALTHALKAHPRCKMPRDFVTTLGDKYPGLVGDKVHPTGTTPIFGLAVPIDKYFVCSRCRQGYANVESFRRHGCKKADAELGDQPPYFLSHVQTFFRGPKLCYFPIDTPTLETNITLTNDFDLSKSQYREVDASDDEVVEPEEYRELNQFLAKEGWVSHIAGCSKSELSELTSLPRHDEYLAPITREVRFLMSNIQSVIGEAGFHVRRLLGKRPSYVVFPSDECRISDFLSIFSDIQR
jgi:hypothetical protein